jgi:hypothetical protein
MAPTVCAKSANGAGDVKADSPRTYAKPLGNDLVRATKSVQAQSTSLLRSEHENPDLRPKQTAHVVTSISVLVFLQTRAG